MNKIFCVLCALTFAFSAVAQENLQPHHRQGVVSTASIGYQYDGNYCGQYGALLTSFVHGYNFRFGLFLGGGIGFVYQPEYTMEWRDVEHNFHYHENTFRLSVPVFLQTKYSFLNRKVSPFLCLRGGLETDFKNREAGWMVNGGVGADIKNFAIELGYSYSILYFGSSNYKVRPTGSARIGFTLQLSYSF